MDRDEMDVVLAATELLKDLSQDDIVAVALHVAGELGLSEDAPDEAIAWIRIQRKATGERPCQLLHTPTGEPG